MKWTLAVVAIVAMGCSNGGSSGSATGTGAPCENDLVCGTGQVCLGGKCGTVECESLSDCGTAQVCIDDPEGSTAKVCTGIQCTVNADCTGGAECKNGVCEGGTAIAGCSEASPCPEGQTCNATTGKCEGGTPGTGVICESCTDDAACGTGASCITLGNGKFCALNCETNGDCSAGFACTEAPGSTSKVCAPGKFECSGCLGGEACAAGTHCNGDTGECAPDLQQCAQCVTDGECGAGFRCLGKGTTRYCVPECATGTCPANSTCKELEGGVKACEWSTDGPCCIGEACTGSPCDQCAGATPYCKDEKCVECLQDLNCMTAEKPKCVANVCVDSSIEPPQCSEPAPHWNSAKQKCCECTQSSHCGGKPCDPNTCTCKDGGNTGGVCDTCVAPYPACAQYNGQDVCVQCTGPEHCNSGQCNTTSYTCEGVVVPNTGNCQEDGCNDPELTCDAGSGLCFNPTGNCDNVTQFCTNGGACLSFLDLFASLGGGGGGGLPLPELPGGGGLPGNCECVPGPLAGFDQGNCPSGLTCSQGFFGILALLDPTFKAPYTCQSGGGLPFP